MLRVIISVSVFLLIASLVAFAEDDKLVAVGGVDPSAMGTVHTDADKNGNVLLKVEVESLADPSKLAPPHQTYIAWIVPNGGSPQVLGELRPDEHQKASLSGTTPSKRFDVLVTAENQPNPTSPSSTVVLKGHVDRK
jgi:hypothetical protein